jgi:signal transduction histidine kinase
MPFRTARYVLIPTLAVSTLLLTVGLGGGWYVYRVNRDVSDALNANLAAAQAAGRLVLAIRDVRLELDRFVDTDDPAYLEAGARACGAVAEAMEEADPRLRADPSRAAGPRGDRLVSPSPQEPLPEGGSGEFGRSMRRTLRAFTERFERLRRGLPNNGRGGEARGLIADLNRDLLIPAERLLRQRQEAARTAGRRNQEIARRIGLGLLLFGVCGAVAGLLVGFGIARSVQRSLVQISLPVRDMAGKLDEVVGPINLSSDGDLTGLDDILRALADKTSDVVRRLQESQQQSLRSEQLAAVGQLAAGLAHELRNPLMSMKLIVQTAAERTASSDPAGDGRMGNPSHGQRLPRDPLGRRDLAVLEEEISRLENMLQTFLDFARPPRPEKESVEVCTTVDRAVEVVGPRAAQQDVRIHWQRREIPLWIEADRAQLRQVLLNLLLNALDALPTGGNIWIGVEQPVEPPGEFSAETDTGTTRHVLIRVADDGPGLSAEVAPRIFEPFVSTKDAGIGLGLSICRRIVESHGGGITAHQRHEGGAEFVVCLPLATPLSCGTAET